MTSWMSPIRPSVDRLTHRYDVSAVLWKLKSLFLILCSDLSLLSCLWNDGKKIILSEQIHEWTKIFFNPTLSLLLL